MSRINWKNNRLNLSRREKHTLFLKGALDAVEPTYLPPINPDALKHFMEGRDAVRQGYVRIDDPQAMKLFILDVEAGAWPARRETRLGAA